MAPVSSTPAAHARTLSSPTPREKIRLARASPRIFSGWLFVETRRKRAFRAQFCVLDDASFRVYSHEVAVGDPDEPDAKTALVSERLLVHVERMHRLNRGILLVDTNGDGLWVHATHDETYFEQWLAVLREAVTSQAVRLTISHYGFAHQSCDEIDGDNRAYAGWFKIRRLFLRGWMAGRIQRMYCVLNGRHLTAFKLNIEGRWADIHGKVTAFRSSKDGKWSEVSLDTGARLLMETESDDGARLWDIRIQAALRQEPRPSASAQRVLAPLTKPPYAPKRVLTY